MPSVYPGSCCIHVAYSNRRETLDIPIRCLTTKLDHNITLSDSPEKRGQYADSNSNNGDNQVRPANPIDVKDTIITTTKGPRDGAVNAAQQVCRSLCDGIYTRFPREVRDMIWTHLVAAPYVFVNFTKDKVFEHYWSVTPYWPTGDGQVESSYFGAHYYKERCVGPHVQYEIIETWYSTLNFYINTYNHDSIYRLLHKDRWNLGIHPFKHITHISIVISERNFDDNINTGSSTTSDSSASTTSLTSLRSENMTLRVKTLLFYLNDLFDLKYGSRITFLLEKKSDFSWGPDNLLKRHPNQSPRVWPWRAEPIDATRDYDGMVEFFDNCYAILHNLMIKLHEAKYKVVMQYEGCVIGPGEEGPAFTAAGSRDKLRAFLKADIPRLEELGRQIRALMDHPPAPPPPPAPLGEESQDNGTTEISEV
ncbi:hypothetical protein BU24DRAFT_74626 [Aaosphaeria arxii CBS 175.79]|uniref:Uncharacterized protein n=1 Tax=Aaosphaeria arxii CBS 175.79 TaxID=1450172 RepID=A0A6A5X9I7_9PLEO|nr:uncharacterized protein BU24DRAFT_74626 [Aaosphaeria arxii CBS 175.79]KAF2009404.1 hypothetical protein BU24DRAFT_74626 [Aaosphaeria arxii CBS 175.79]